MFLSIFCECIFGCYIILEVYFFDMVVFWKLFDGFSFEEYCVVYIKVRELMNDCIFLGFVIEGYVYWSLFFFWVLC